MENIKKDLDGQGFLFNKDNYLKEPEDFFKKYSKEFLEDMTDVFGYPLDEMDRKADSHLFGNKSL